MIRRSFLISASAIVALPAVARERVNPMPDELREAIERDPTAPVLGNPQGNITLTEFFDYNCPFCRQMVDPMHRLIASDPQLRVVFHEWPVFGEDSEYAARASLASLRQGKYWQMHTGLFKGRGRANADKVRRVARDAGIDQATLERDMENPTVENHITESFLLGDHMSLAGTPSFIAGDEGAFGAFELTELRGLVSRARQALGVDP